MIDAGYQTKKSFVIIRKKWLHGKYFLLIKQPIERKKNDGAGVGILTLLSKMIGEVK
ncbi:MAG: hypothetical protein KKE17_02540 [Proteobacteria bacterium]|nr:hypothetical protein [Pseudomonadota bacterium]MBU1708859.1 hypothetical protein [Pseudomonadota bacterium]